ncbi:MAG: beta-lactamase family protein, partial [Gemmatimonadota bacterium]|nr:beta-lactamase family protein [Gemmatimonadota bacterium]
MADIDRFPARSIGRGDGPVFEFSVVGDDASSGDRYDSAFRPLVLRTEAGPDTVPFEEFLERWDTWSFLVMRRDTLLGEWYFAGKAGDKVETTFSASKSLLSAAVGVALKEGFVDGVDDPITRYVPELAARDPRFEGLTLRHLLTMSSGIGFSRGKGPWGDEARSYYHPDLRSVALSRDLVRDPGETFQYNFYNPLLIGLALERASGISVSQMIEDGFWSRIGAEEDASWSLDSRRHGFEKMESGFNAAPRDLLRFGRLMLNRGSWDGEELLPPEWVDVSTAADSIGDPNLEYAYMWWVNPVENRPPDFYAAGRFGQYVYVVPDLEMV